MLPTPTPFAATEAAGQYVHQHPIDIISRFMMTGGQTVGRYDPTQALMYVGLMCEELAETIEEIAKGSLYPTPPVYLSNVVEQLKFVSQAFKSGQSLGDFMRADAQQILDGMLDTAWVAFGAALSFSPNVKGAFAEVARANLDKYPNGQVIKDANGKVMKPSGWRGPDHSPYIDSSAA